MAQHLQENNTKRQSVHAHTFVCVCVSSVLGGGLGDVIPNQVANCLYRSAQGALSSGNCTEGKWQGQ